MDDGMDLGIIFSENAALYFRKVQTLDRVVLKIAKRGKHLKWSTWIFFIEKCKVVSRNGIWQNINSYSYIETTHQGLFYV